MLLGFVGSPGSGKTTLARALCSACRRLPNIKTVELVSEYARRYISKYGPIENIFEQYRIMTKQLEWEDTVLSKYDMVITDSPIHMGFLYAIDISKKTPKDVMVFNDIFKEMTKISMPIPRYDIIFHLPPKLKPVEDGVRIEKHFDETWRQESNNIIKSIFKIFPPKKFIEIQSTDINERIEECIKYIKPTF